MTLLLTPKVGATTHSVGVTPVVNIVLDGNQKVEYRNTLLSVEGKIVVRGNATLILKGVNVRFSESDLKQVFEITENGSLIVEESDIIKRVKLNESASLYAENSSFYESRYCSVHKYNHTSGGIIASGSSTVTLSQCRLSDIRTEDKARIQAVKSEIYRSSSDSGHLEVIDSSLEIYWRTMKNSSLEIKIPNLTAYSGDLEFLHSTDTYFLNTTIEKIWLTAYDCRLILVDSSLELFNSYGLSYIDIKNCSVQTLNSMHSEVEIKAYDSEFEYLRTYLSNNTMTLVDCTINTLEYSGVRPKLNATRCTIDSLTMEEVISGNQIIYLKDTTIGSFRPSLGKDSPTEYLMDNVTITDSIWFNVGVWEASKGVNLIGDMDVSQSATLNGTIIDGYATINRFYPVYFIENQIPLTGVPVSLRIANKTRNVGTTNEDGFIEVPVRYMNVFKLTRPPDPPGLVSIRNMTDTVQLVWEIDGQENYMEISLKTGTPISIETGSGGLRVLIVPMIIALLFVFIWKQG